MYCPNCGQSNQIVQRYCRTCGLNLDAIVESLTVQLNAGDVRPSDRRLESFGNFVFGGLGVVGIAGVAGLIYTIITKFIFSGQGVLFGVFVSLFIVFCVLALVYVILNEGRKEKGSNRAKGADLPPVEAPDTAKLLNTGKFEPVPSVVDDTTELLKIKARARKI